MKEKILEAFSELGFKLEQTESGSYTFRYEGTTFLYLYNEDDESFLSLAIPCICEYEEGKASRLFLLTEKINSTLKYVKAYNINDSVWLFYERELLNEEEDLKMTISRMVLHLDSGYAFASRTIKAIDEAMDEPADDENNETEESDAIEDIEETDGTEDWEEGESEELDILDEDNDEGNEEQE